MAPKLPLQKRRTQFAFKDENRAIFESMREFSKNRTVPGQFPQDHFQYAHDTLFMIPAENHTRFVNPPRTTQENSRVVLTK